MLGGMDASIDGERHWSHRLRIARPHRKAKTSAGSRGRRATPIAAVGRRLNRLPWRVIPRKRDIQCVKRQTPFSLGPRFRGDDTLLLRGHDILRVMVRVTQLKAIAVNVLNAPIWKASVVVAKDRAGDVAALFEITPPRPQAVLIDEAKPFAEARRSKRCTRRCQTAICSAACGICPSMSGFVPTRTGSGSRRKVFRPFARAASCLWRT